MIAPAISFNQPPPPPPPDNMKLTLMMISFAAVAAQASPMTERVSAEELNERRASGTTTVIDLRSGEAADVRAARPADESLINQSRILSDGTNWTLVPEGSVLFVPATLEDRVNVRPIGNLLSWRDFLTENHAWLSAEEVSLRQAEGVKPLNEERVSHWSKRKKVIIAVHLGGPISVHAPERPEAQVTNHR